MMVESDNKTSIFRLPLVQVIVALSLLYIVSVFFTQARWVVSCLRGVDLTVSAALVVIYRQSAWAAITSYNPKPGDVLGLGIFFAWLATLTLEWLLFFQDVVDSDFMAKDQITSLFLFFRFIAAILHMAAPSVGGVGLAKVGWPRIGLIVFVGAVLGVGVTLSKMGR
jgi:hypothetical protein